MSRGKMGMDVDAIVLAAGLSRRMGTNKLLLPFTEDGTQSGRKNGTVLGTFLQHIPYDLFRSVIVVYSDDLLLEIIDRFPVIATKNVHPERGKSSTIQQGLGQSSAADGVMFFVGDQPLLRERTIRELFHAFTMNPCSIIFPHTSGRSGNPVIFPAFCRSALLRLRADEGGKQLFPAYAKSIKRLECGSPEEFIDVDTPEKYQFVLSLQREKRGQSR